MQSMLNVIFEIDDQQYNAIEDWQCYPMEFEIGGAQAKQRTIDIPYRDGLLYVSESFGGVHYSNRTIEIPFLILHKCHARIHSEICNILNGKKARIRLSTDPEWYYIGYINIGTYYSNNWQWIFTMMIDAEPYRVNVSSGEKLL